MVEAQAPNAAAAPDSDRGRIIAILIYGFYLAAFINGITAIIGVVLAYVGRSEARGTVYESHYDNAIHVFWVSLIASFVLIGLAVWSGLVLAGFGVAAAAVHAPAPFWFVFTHSWPFGLLSVSGIGVLVLLVWYLYRTIAGLVRALDGKPY